MTTCFTLDSRQLKLLLFSLLVLIAGHITFAQTPLEIQYTEDDGLASNYVYRALQDHDGFMWFSTDKGVSKFDGYTFKNFTLKDGLPYNDIYDFKIDKDGIIWLETFNEVCYIENDSVHTLPLPDNFKGAGISKHIINNKGTHIIQYEPIKGTYLEIIDGRLLSKELPPGSTAILELIDSDHMILLASEKGKRSLLEFKEGSIIWEENIVDIVNSFFTQSRIEIDGWLYFFDGKFNYRLRNTHFEAFPIDAFQGLDNDWVSLKSFSDRIIYQGERENFVFDKDLNIVDDLDYLKDKKFTSFFVDKELNTWVCTPKGVSYYLSSPSKSLNYIIDDKTDGYVSMSKDDNKLLLSSQKGKIFTFDKTNGCSEIMSTELAMLDQIHVSKQSGEKFALDLGLGVVPLRKISEVPLRRQQARKNLWVWEDRIRPIIPEFIRVSPKDMDSNENGDYAIAHSRGTTLIRQDSSSQVCDFRSYAVAFQKESLWIGTLSGLYLYDNHRLKKIKIDGSNPYVQKLYVDLKNDLWVVTDGNGLWNYDGQRFQNILPNNDFGINNIFINEENEIWLATTNGLILLTKVNNKYTPRKFGSLNGIKAKNIIDVFTDSTEIYALSTEELSILKRGQQDKRERSSFSFEKLKVNGIEIPDFQNLSLNSNENNIQIDYKTLSYANLGGVIYRWKLEGLDTLWRTTRNTFQIFNVLAPGKYTFNIESFDTNGQLLMPVEKLHFRIQKPWYLSWPFFLILGAILFFSGWYYDRRRNQQEEIKAKEEAEILSKFYELRLKAVQAQMNPHFIFNALNSIQSFIYNREPEEANQFIVQFAKLMRLILESTSKNFSYLKDEIELINLYVSLEQLRFNNKFEYKLNIDEDIYKKDIIVPSTILQPFVENAINHGIAPKTTKSILKINVTIKEDFLCCIIEDDGIGREEAARRKKSSHTSRAMNIIQERKQILKKRDNIDIDFNFEDLKNPIGTGTGTRVTILVPTNIAN